MVQRPLDAWDKVLAEEDEEDKEEEQIMKDIEQLKQEQGQKNLNTEERIQQFETLADLYLKGGKTTAAVALRREATDLTRLTRQAEARKAAAEAKAKADEEAEAARVAKLREISTALKFSDKEFQELLAAREKEERKRRGEGKGQGEEWGTGWRKRGEGPAKDGTPQGKGARLPWPLGSLWAWVRRLFTTLTSQPTSADGRAGSSVK